MTRRYTSPFGFGKLFLMVQNLLKIKRIFLDSDQGIYLSSIKQLKAVKRSSNRDSLSRELVGGANQ